MSRWPFLFGPFSSCPATQFIGSAMGPPLPWIRSGLTVQDCSDRAHQPRVTSPVQPVQDLTGIVHGAERDWAPQLRRNRDITKQTAVSGGRIVSRIQPTPN